MQKARGQCSNRRQVSNKYRVSIKRWGYEVHVLVNPWAFIRRFTELIYTQYPLGNAVCYSLLVGLLVDVLVNKLAIN